MRIAYIAVYQGPKLLKHRPSLHNLSLGCKIKVELISELLRQKSNDVEIFSQGPIDEFQFKFYPATDEAEPFHPDIPIHYSSALPIKFLTGLWEGWSTRRLFQARHRASPFDVVIIQTLKSAQLACADFALRHLGLPVIFEYEDDQFVDVQGKASGSFKTKLHHRRYAAMMRRVSGCMAVSPHLLSQMPPAIPKLLLRGVVSESIVKLTRQPDSIRKNRVVFSGTHEWSQGLEQLVQAWKKVNFPDWELHFAGHGPLTARLMEMAQGDPSIIFHGFLSREENARLLCSAKIGLNPQDVTQIPGTSFAFKIIEYLAAGLHVITTPRGALEPELERGVTYITNNAAATIAASLEKVVTERLYERPAREAALEAYGPDAIARGLNRLIEQVTAQHRGQAAPINSNHSPAPTSY